MTPIIPAEELNAWLPLINNPAPSMLETRVPIVDCMEMLRSYLEFEKADNHLFEAIDLHHFGYISDDAYLEIEENVVRCFNAYKDAKISFMAKWSVSRQDLDEYLFRKYPA